MKYDFSLIIAGISERTPELAGALYEATGDEIEFDLVGGVGRIEFMRVGTCLRKAVLSAIRQVESVPGLHIEHVESESASVIAQINAELARAG